MDQKKRKKETCSHTHPQTRPTVNMWWCPVSPVTSISGFSLHSPCPARPAGVEPGCVRWMTWGSRFSAPSAGYSAPWICSSTRATTLHPPQAHLVHFHESIQCWSNIWHCMTHLWFWLMSSPILQFCSSMRELFSNTSFFKHSFS